MRLRTTSGVYPTTVYWHAGNKAELLASVCQRILGELQLPPVSATLPWDDWIVWVARTIRSGLRDHPNIVPLIGSQLQVSSSSFGLANALLGVLEEAGFPPSRLPHVYNVVIGFIFGWAFTELAAPPTDASPQWKTQFADELSSVDPKSYPHLQRHAAAMADRTFMLRWSSGLDAPMADSFALALRVLVNGLKSELGTTS